MKDVFLEWIGEDRFSPKYLQLEKGKVFAATESDAKMFVDCKLAKYAKKLNVKLDDVET